MADPRADVEQALAVLDTYHRQIDAVSRQLQFLQALHGETRRARETLEGLQAEPSAEILMPLGASTFIHGQATQKGTAISGIGAGLSVEKSWEETQKLLAAREQEIAAEVQRLSEAGVRLQQEAAALEEEIQAGMPGQA